MDHNLLTGGINKAFGVDIRTSDGETFTITMGGFSVHLSWYYRGSNDKFDFKTPITRDTHIEMMISTGGLEFDNETLKDLSEMLEGFN